MVDIPSLSLSHGQAAWAIALGREPTKTLLNSLRYLRLLGLPFSAAEQGQGRGNRMRYGFDHLVELGISVWALDHGMRPKDLKGYIATERLVLRQLYRDVLVKLPSLEEEWVRSRGAIILGGENDIFLRMHGRYAEQPGKIDYPQPSSLENFPEAMGFGDLQEAGIALLPLSYLVPQWVYWAFQAPELKTGP